MVSVEEAARTEFDEALQIVCRQYGLSLYEFRRSFKVRLVNTASGWREYYRVKHELPEVESCQYGSIEEVEGKHFIHINSDLWRSGYDMIPTFIHELLHILEPTKSETEIAREEKEICEHADIWRDNILGPVRS